MSITYDDSTIQSVKDAADIVEVVGENVTLKKAGTNYKGLCPFHSEKTPSFTVNQARRSFHCFGCGEGGDVLAFVMRVGNINFVEALKLLAQRYNITLPEKALSHEEQESATRKKILYDINEQAVHVYHDFLLHDKAAAPARQYLEQRSIPTEIIETFQLGFAPDRWEFLLKELAFSAEDVEAAGLIVPNKKGGYYDRFRNRVLFPIQSHNGQHLGFGGRILGDQQPKYMNTPETQVYNKSRTLFGLYNNKEAIRTSKRCLIVEGNFDLLALVARGVREVVAPLGTALTRQHVRAMKGFCQEAYLLFDGDRAGVQAAMRAVPLFLSEKIPAKVILLPDGHDPDTFVSEYGRQRLEQELKKAASLPEFLFNSLVKKHGLTLEGKGKIVEELQPVISAIADKDLQRSLFISHFSQKLGLTQEQLLSRQSKPLVQAREKNQIQGSPVDLKMSKIEEQLLSFLIIYPEYLESLLEAGLNEALTHPSAQIILNRLKELLAEKSQYGPEHLMNVTVGKEREFVSKQLISAPFFPDQEKDAQEKIRWLKENRVKVRMRSLTARINEAQRLNDQELFMELLSEKNRINEKSQEK